MLEEQTAVAARGNNRGRDHHRSAEFDQERECEPRPRDEAKPVRQTLVFQHEAAHRLLSGMVWSIP